MALEVLGGPLSFSAEIDLNSFDSQLGKMSSSIQEVATKAIASSKTQAESVSAIIKSIAPDGAKALDETIRKVQNLHDEQKKFQDLINETSDPKLLSDYKGKLEEVQKLLEKAPQEMNSQVEQILLDNIRKVSEGMDLAAQGQLSASRELKQIKAQLASAPADSPINQELLARAAELKDKINDINEAVKLTGSDTSGFDALMQATRGVAAGFTVLQGPHGYFRIGLKEYGGGDQEHHCRHGYPPGCAGDLCSSG
jgi:predicted Zn-dependent protease